MRIFESNLGYRFSGLSTSTELGGALFEKSGRALFFVFRCDADRKKRSFQEQTFLQCRIRSFVHCVDGKPYANWRVGNNLLQDGFGASNEIGKWDDFIHEA